MLSRTNTHVTNVSTGRNTTHTNTRLCSSVNVVLGEVTVTCGHLNRWTNPRTRCVKTPNRVFDNCVCWLHLSPAVPNRMDVRWSLAVLACRKPGPTSSVYTNQVRGPPGCPNLNSHPHSGRTTSCS